MKVRDSGMPDQKVWQSFFNPITVLSMLGLSKDCQTIVDFGCGYGTFALAAAKLTEGKVIALDIDPQMLAAAKTNATVQKVDNIRFIQCDFMSDGTGLEGKSVDYAMIFNLLHADQPLQLLSEAHRVLKKTGKLAILHWNHDEKTPRGPDMSFRPHPSHILTWVKECGFVVDNSSLVDLPPYHYGLMAYK